MRIKYFLSGLIVGLVIATSSVAIAATETITDAVWARYNVVINGSEPKEIETIAHHDTAYYPVRSLANMLGYDVTWKADSRTIVFTTTVTESVYEYETGVDNGTATEGSGTITEGEANVDTAEDQKRMLQTQIQLKQQNLQEASNELTRLQESMAGSRQSYLDIGGKPDLWEASDRYKIFTELINKQQAIINQLTTELTQLQADLAALQQ